MDLSRRELLALLGAGLAASAVPTSSYAHVAARPRVLAVDGDPVMAEYLGGLFSRMGCRTFAAFRGEDALQNLGTLSPDLVTLGTVFEDIDGFEILRRIKKVDPHLPVIMISWSGSAPSIVKAMQLGATNYLLKPVEIDELEEAAREALGQSPTTL